MTSTAHGAAIYSHTSYSVLIDLTSCVFKDCKASKNGGAIYVNQSTSLIVTDTLFHNCATNSDENEPGGGAIRIRGSGSTLSVSSSIFFSCNANVGSHGGGALRASSMSNVLLSTSRFISCSSQYSAGAVYIDNSTPVTYTTILFNGNSASKYGGAMRESGTSLSSTHIKFCFFTGNTGTYGNDYAVSKDLSYSPFIHSFSTGASNRVAYYDDGSFTYHDNWLPQGSIYFVSSTSWRNLHALNQSSYS